MPFSALKPCVYPSCQTLVRSGYCEKHAGSVPPSFQRDPERQRLYDRRWQMRRARHLGAHPWCEICLQSGLYVPATDVHHLVPHRGDVHIFNTSPLQSLCHSCHSKITAVEGEGA